MAFKFVEDKEFLRRAQSVCTRMVKELEQLLRDDYDINSQMFLIGSGARNMVTQNGKGNIDFDINLNILDGFEYDEHDLKDDVRCAFNEIMEQEELSDVHDSTSVLTTTLMCFKDYKKVKFKIDLGIVTLRNNQWYRLTYNKKKQEYYWTPAPNSKNVKDKADKIKALPGKWEEVRERYINKKNLYLSRQDHNHPSFICYIEAVNEVYNDYFY